MEKMKNTICLLLFILLCAIFPVHAQVTEVCVGNGIDTVTLFVDNYQYGKIQWQRSDDTLHWTDIPGANDTVYRFLPDKICFYRAWMQYPNCPADSSPITHIQFVPKANAGHDRILNTGYVTHLNGNAVNDARYMWHVIEGDSANIENPYSHQSQFSGPDTLYRLTWTVANACGLSTDTVKIRYMESRFYDAIAVVDTTDLILSDSAELAAGVYTIVFSNPAPIITDSTVLMGLVDESFLRKVLSFEYFGDTCKLITSQAYLTDILLKGPVNLETPLDFTGNTRRGTGGHYHTRAELLADPRFQNGQWSSLLQDVIQAGHASTNRYLNGFISVGPYTLSGGVMLKDLSLQFSDDSRFDADAWIDPDDFKLHFFATVVGDLYIDFILRFSESVNLSITYDIPTPLSIPIGKAVKLGLFVPVEITGAMQMDSGFEIPVHVTQPLDLGVFYQGYGTPSSLINGVSWRNNSGEMVKEVITDDLPNNLGLEVAFSVGAKLELEIFERAGAFFRALPTLSYSVCYGANGFKTESVQSFVNLDVAAYLKLFGEGSGGVTKHWTKSPMYWRSPYRLARGRWNNQYMTHPNDLTTPHALDVFLYNQDNRPVKRSKVLFVTTDGVVSTQQSGEGSSAVFVNTNDNGCANIYWRPSNGPDTKMYAVVQDCAGNNIVGSPVVYHSSIMSSPCHNSTLSLDVVNGALRQSGGVWPYQYSADGTTWSPLKPWPLIPDTTYYVKDNNGCEANVTYKEPEVITACDLALDVEQDGFTVSMEASNGVFPLHFYVDSTDQTPNGINNNTYQHTFSREGEHSLMVTDANGCTVTMHVQLTDEITLPVVYTVARYNTASGIYNEVMGAVTDNGGDTLLARGIECALSEDMSYSILVSNDFSDDGLGTFVCTISAVSPGMIYYARAYATNSKGTAYGKVIRIAVPASLPTVTTNTVSNITTETATCGGNVVTNGGAAITARGVCWSTSPNPTIDDYYTTDGNSTGNFTSSITGLTQSTTYYVRAYATNSVGTAYGEQQSFTTAFSNPNDGQSCPGAATVTDYDNNTYNTVQIGNQCWMKNNLRTTHYANGESIPLGSNTSTTATYYNYDSYYHPMSLSLRGYLYNWVAVMHGESSSSTNPSGVQGICPTGWHVPSEAEWTQLRDYVSTQSQYVCNGTSYKIAKALSYTNKWESTSYDACAPGYSQSTNNATRFGIVPAGYCGKESGTSSFYFEAGQMAFFWSATENDDNYNKAWFIDLMYDYYGVHIRSSGVKYAGYSVRCLRD